MATLRLISLGMEGRDAMVTYIEEQRTKALSPLSEIESLCFRSSLFTIFFEPCMSAFQGKIYQIIPSLSVERLSRAARSRNSPRSATKLSRVGSDDLLY